MTLKKSIKNIMATEHFPFFFRAGTVSSPSSPHAGRGEGGGTPNPGGGPGGPGGPDGDGPGPSGSGSGPDSSSPGAAGPGQREPPYTQVRQYINSFC